MEQDVSSAVRLVCSTCLSSDRDLICLNELTQIYQVFRLLMYDFPSDRFADLIPEMEQYICWECLALMRKFLRFKNQVQSAQEHLRVLAISQTQESLDHTYMSNSLSSLDTSTKVSYDKIFVDYTQDPDWHGQYLTPEPVKNEQYDITQVVRNNIQLDVDHNLSLEVPTLDLDGQVCGIMSHIVVNADNIVGTETFTHTVKGELTSDLTAVSTVSALPHIQAVFMCDPTTLERKEKKENPTPKNYDVEVMSEADMLESREEAKQKVQYASAIYKCELCIIGFYTQTQVEEHFVSHHRPSADTSPCKICYVYLPTDKLAGHLDDHYTRYRCRLCPRTEHSERLMERHSETHLTRRRDVGMLHVDGPTSTKGRKKKDKDSATKPPPKPGDLRKLLSKTTIEGYQCLECDMFFKNSRSRKNHVARFHREGLQCDHCKKRFVNRTTLATHLRLHEGPLPTKECYICHKMVRVIQLKYHIQRHQNKSRYECVDCNKVFSHLATYQAHLKYSRAHASDNVFKFPCPMCNKGYPSKEAMQDHFNYQHLGKTTHRCPVCAKPIASRANVDKHMMRVHGEKKEKPRNHVCQQCGKAFTDKKSLTQHEVIHSAERPLACDICHQTFRQKASLYTHRKRVHKVFPNKRVVEFMDTKHVQ